VHVAGTDRWLWSFFCTISLNLSSFEGFLGARRSSSLVGAGGGVRAGAGISAQTWICVSVLLDCRGKHFGSLDEAELLAWEEDGQRSFPVCLAPALL
jgi:hypothetical protein